MPVVVILSLATACLLLVQAIHILKTGDTHLFFLSKTREGLRRQTLASTKVGAVLVYGAPACAILLLLFLAATRSGGTAIMRRIAEDFGNLFGGVLLFSIGLLGVLSPTSILKGVQAAYPSADVDRESGFAAVLTRVLGAVLLGFGLLVLNVVKGGR